MALFTDIVACIVGVLFMWLAFFATGIRPGLAFGRGPSYPISKPGRVIFFLAGMAVFIDGLERLLGHSGWHVAVPFVAVAALALFLKSKFVRSHMQRAGRNGPTVAIDFVNGLPAAMIGARIAFFVIVAMMVILGIGPVADSTARLGVIACVIALFVVALVYDALERHYINTGRATVMKLRHHESTGRNAEQ